jgi:hypothetical protein
MSFLTTHLSKTSDTLFHYSPFSTTSSTLFHYAPLSSATSISLHTSTSPHSTTTLIRTQLPTSTGQLGSLLALSNLPPSATKTSSLHRPLATDSGILDPSMGFTVVILTILGLLMALTIIIWWTETHACENYRSSEGDKLTTLSHRRVSEPVGLGISMQSSKEGKRNTKCCERLRGWFPYPIVKAQSAIAVKRWTNSAVDMLRAELDTDAEEGLLLPVQEIERTGREKNQAELFKLDPDSENSAA